MRTAFAILALLAASPAHGASWQCALWPKTCEQAVAVPPQPIAPSPVIPAPAPAVRPAHPVPHTQTGRPPKPKWKAAPKRKVMALPDWCARVPKGTSMWQVEAAAPLWGVTLTEKNREQARACLASK